MRSAPPAEARFAKSPLLPAPLPNCPGVPLRPVVPTAPDRVLGRLPPCLPTCCRAPACRFASESPRAVPPNLFAVARLPYGVPPRCDGLCCHRFPALATLPLRTLELRTKLLLLLML